MGYLECNAADGWEWLQVLGFGQLWHQILRLYCQAHLACARCQVQIQTSLKPLADKVRPGRHLPQARVLLRHKRQLASVALLGGPLPLFLFLDDENNILEKINMCDIKKSLLTDT